ncbi:hypothetical protein ABEB36_009742 [Hypothenemus hampei]|uniref:Uncharacterized protein n=1 Tax=Hypothenemus hampei TaxID=57062 RepID=A0ABD1EHQ3_HYPHA
MVACCKDCCNEREKEENKESDDVKQNEQHNEEEEHCLLRQTFWRRIGQMISAISLISFTFFDGFLMASCSENLLKINV